MSKLVFRRTTEKEKDLLRERLRLDALEVKAVLRTHRNLQHVFRCAVVWDPDSPCQAGPLFELQRLSRDRWEAFCWQTGLCARPKLGYRASHKNFKLVLSEGQKQILERQQGIRGRARAAREEAEGHGDSGSSTRTLVQATNSVNPEQHSTVMKSEKRDGEIDHTDHEVGNPPLSEEQRVESQARLFAAQKAMQKEEEINDTYWSQNEAPEVGKFNRKLSLGSGLSKRSGMSSRALQNLVMALEPAGQRRHAAVLSEADIRDMFFFVAEDEKVINFEQFVFLILFAAERRYTDIYDDDPHKAVHSFYMDYLLGYNQAVMPAGIPEMRAQGPLRRYHGVEEVVTHLQIVLERCFNVIAAAETTATREKFLELMCEVGVLERFANMNESELSSLVEVALCNELEQSSSTQDGMTFDQFVDATILVSYYAYSIEPHATNLPTIPQRFFAFVMTWDQWFSKYLTMPLHGDLVPVELKPPRILSVTPLVVDMKNAATVSIIGEQVPQKGIFVRFGDLVSISSVLNPFDFSVKVPVPPVDADTIVVQLLPHDDGELHCRVTREKKVVVAMSVDGRDFSQPMHERFVYEDTTPVFSLRAYQSKVQRVFTNYTTFNDPMNTTALNLAQWTKFLKDFKLHDPFEEQSDESVDPADVDLEADGSLPQVELDCFNHYAGPAHPSNGRKSIPHADDEDIPARTLKKQPKVLTFQAFLKAIIRLFVKRGEVPLDAIRELLESDVWVGRTLLSDVPTTHRGEFSLRLRRAANSFNIVKLVENMEHNNSPRGGSEPVLEGVASTGMASRSVPIFDGEPLGRWENEVSHQKMVLDFVSKGEQENESLLVQRYKEAVDCGGTVLSPGRPVDSSALAVELQAETQPKRPPSSHEQLDPVQVDRRAGTPSMLKRPDPMSESLVNQQRHSTTADATAMGLASPSQTLSPKVGKQVIQQANSPDGKLYSQEDMADPKLMVKRQTQQIILHVQREEYGRILRREKDKDERTKRQVCRLMEELEAEKAKCKESTKQLESMKKEPSMEFAGSSKGVLQAEKEELQRIFVYELEKKRHQMVQEQAHDENMRDIERDRVVTELKDQLNHQDHMYGKMQETTRVQGGTIDKQATVLDTMKKRLNLFRVDGSFFRETHDQLIAAVDGKKHKDLIESIETQRNEHEITMNAVAQQMIREAKKEGKRLPNKAKDLLPPGKKSVASLPDDGGSDGGFSLPDVEKPLVTFSQEEVDDKLAAALEEQQRRSDGEKYDLEKQMRDMKFQQDTLLFDLKTKLSQVEAASPGANTPLGDGAESTISVLQLAISNAENASSRATTVASTANESPQILENTTSGGEIAISVSAAEAIEDSLVPTGAESVSTPHGEEHDAQCDAQTVAVTVTEPVMDENGKLVMVTVQQSGEISGTPLNEAIDTVPQLDLTAGTMGPPQIVYQRRPSVPKTTTEAQTDTPRVKKVPPPPTVVDEYAKYFGRSLDIVLHPLSEGDTAASVSKMYDVPLLAFLRANFLIAPQPDAPEGEDRETDEEVPAERIEDASNAMHGIPNRRVRIPVPLGAKSHYEMLGRMRGARDPTPPPTALLPLNSIVVEEPVPGVVPPAPKNNLEEARGDEMDGKEAPVEENRNSPLDDCETNSHEPRIVDMDDSCAVDVLQDSDVDSDDRVVYDDGSVRDDVPEEDDSREAALTSELKDLRQQHLATVASSVEKLTAARVATKGLREELASMRQVMKDMPTVVVDSYSSQILTALKREGALKYGSSPPGEQSNTPSSIQELDRPAPRQAETHRQTIGDPNPDLALMIPPGFPVRRTLVNPRASLEDDDVKQRVREGPSPVPVTPLRSVSTFSNSPLNTHSIVVSAVATHSVDHAFDKRTGRHVNALIHDNEAKVVIHQEFVQRGQIVVEAEKFFQSLVVRHEHAWSRFQDSKVRHAIRADTEKKIKHVLHLKGEEKRAQQIAASQRQLEEEEAQAGARRRRSEKSHHLKELNVARQAQLEAKAVVAVRQKRMLQEHTARKNAPTKVAFVPMALQNQIENTVDKYAMKARRNTELPPLESGPPVLQRQGPNSQGGYRSERRRGSLSPPGGVSGIAASKTSKAKRRSVSAMK